MPAIKSSSKAGTSVVLFANERRSLTSAMQVSVWLQQHCTSDVSDAALKVVEAVGELLKLMPTPEVAQK